MLRRNGEWAEAGQAPCGLARVGWDRARPASCCDGLPHAQPDGGHASGTTLGTATISANPISRFITFSVPKASLGTPGPGWGFTVVLTGLDGFSPDQARGFAPTPQDFQFGVCATASGDPHCTFNPALVPKAVDVITAPGVQQSTMLDYTLGPVVLTGVALP